MSSRDPTLSQRWALRALAEGERPTLERLAEASGRSLKWVAQLAEEGGWVMEVATQDDVAARLRALAKVLLEKFEALGREAMEEGGKIDRTELDGIVAMIRSIEKIGEIMQPQPVAKEKNQNRQDEDLAAVLQCINDRIVKLAREIAAQMVAGTVGSASGAAGAGGMVP